MTDRHRFEQFYVVLVELDHMTDRHQRAHFAPPFGSTSEDNPVITTYWKIAIYDLDTSV